MRAERPINPTILFVFLLPYLFATLFHHIHNAEFLKEYPNMPEWLSPAGVYSAWLAQTAIGVLGYVLTRLGHKLVGLGMLTAYAAFGFYGLAHYLRAPLSAHTLTMNVTIWLEAATGAMLLVALLGSIRRHLRPAR
ncbi:MAG TPA: hypothetical protein VKF40_23905 [Burkholderiales bacterium]|nr:hypothetical protein [Burkholderiales bacterium]